MTKNMGTLDRVLRIAVAIVLAVLALNGTLEGPLAIGAWIIVAIFVVTSIIGSCPAYRLIGMNTCSNR